MAEMHPSANSDARAGISRVAKARHQRRAPMDVLWDGATKRLKTYGSWQFPKIQGPNRDPKWKGSYCKDTHKTDPQLMESASCFSTVSWEKSQVSPGELGFKASWDDSLQLEL